MRNNKTFWRIALFAMMFFAIGCKQTKAPDDAKTMRGEPTLVYIRW